MSVTVRPATVADATRIAEIHVESWRNTYADVLSAELLAGLSVQRRAASWTAMIEAGQPVHLAELDGTVAGFAAAGPGRGEDSPRALELYAIYQVSAAHGSGTGQALLDAAIGEAPAFLWVAEANPRAHAFYGRNRFAPDGARQIAEAIEDLAEIRMTR